MTAYELVNALKFRREFLRLRQEDLAEMSGVTARTISQIESGKGNPSFATLQKLAMVMGMEITLQVKKTD